MERDGVVEELHLLRNNSLVVVTPDEDGNIKIYDTVEDYPSKLSYCGQVNDLHCPHGRGTIFYDASQTILQKYVGEISQGNWNGIGVLTYKDGTVADGTFHWEDESNEFRGKKTFPNGDVVFGEWFDDKLEYVSKVDFADGRKLTDGKSHDDRRLLICKLYLPGRGIFTGTIRIDFFEPCNGTIHLLDGRVYTGDSCFLDDTSFFCIHGRGKMTLTDGSSYSGEWYRNEIHSEAYGKLALVGELSGEICGHLNHCGLMQRYLRQDKFSGWVTKHAQEQEEEDESEVAEDNYDEWLEKRNRNAEGYEEEEIFEPVASKQTNTRYHYDYDPDDEGYAQAREHWGENAARKEGLERLAKKEQDRELRESTQHDSS
jgi:hypothetical protein